MEIMVTKVQRQDSRFNQVYAHSRKTEQASGNNNDTSPIIIITLHRLGSMY